LFRNWPAFVPENRRDRRPTTLLVCISTTVAKVIPVAER
jgi:hypothetical protein